MQIKLELKFLSKTNNKSWSFILFDNCSYLWYTIYIQSKRRSLI
ncbi:hypothetical protein [Staphylococcus phage vB_SauM-V1SA20]|nr:hypothetical protein [Staphylococcus phage vB_SauM-V1SA20]